MRITAILAVLIPVFVVIGLGFFAGKRRVFDGDQVEGFNEFVLGFALPAMIFVAVLGTSRSTLAKDFVLFAAISAVLLLFMGLGLALGMLVLKLDLASSTIVGMLVAVPTAAFMGTPILSDLFSEATATDTVSMYAFAINVAALPLSIVLLEWGTRSDDETRSFGIVLGEVLRRTGSKAIVWAPLAAVVLVVIGVKVPDPFDSGLSLIGQSTSAVALFASGLILSRYHLRAGAQPITLALIKNIAQPVAMLGLAALFGITGTLREEAIILTAMPASVVAPMFAVRYGRYEAEAASALVVGTGLSLVTLLGTVALVGT